MNAHPKIATLICAAALVIASAATNVRADDTEIFVMKPPSGVNTRPNILFIMDTSGSMDTQVVDKEDYDPKTEYTGTCSRDRVYWNEGDFDSVPKCNEDYWVSASNFLCKTAADKLAEHGSWPIGPAARWSSWSDRWVKLEEDRDTYVECQADAAIKHGMADNDGKVPRNGNDGPFTKDASKQISWTGDANGSYVFYSGNYINWYRNAPSTKLGTRMSIVKKAAKETLDRLTDVNVGLMRFSSDAEGGMVIHEMADIATARTKMKETIDAMDSNGGTPLSETMLEAYRYWTGAAVGYGTDSTVGPDNYRKTFPSVDGSRTGADLKNYKSPLGAACQKNFIVYLTDGDPTVDQGAEASIEGLKDFKTLANMDPTKADNGGQCTENGALGTEGGGATKGDGKCLDDLARYMAQKDFYDDPALEAVNDPKENIRTFTIGLGDGVSERGLALLKATAVAGEGKFYEADNSASLVQAFNSIISSVLSDNLSFTAPAVSVNAFNRTQNLNDLFISVFKPDDRFHWAGNLKKYRLDPTGVIKDKNGKDAVDENAGFFRKDATSFWSDSADGADVEKGGAAHKITPPATRKIYTDLAAFAAKDADSSLLASGSAFIDTNAALTPKLLGMPAAATVDDAKVLINWARGQGASTTRFEMGDPLHSRPTSVIYGGSASDPEAVVFVATNDGYLHAIDPKTGEELWAYIPSELLDRLYDLRANVASPVKRYGIDGNLVAYRIDRDGDGKIESGDKVLLFFGMGRGGDNYYALDITTKDKPKLLWRIGADDELPGVGETWSTPVITKVNVSGESQNSDRLVMIVGGGYDATQDAVEYNTDDIGNRVYMVDALSGKLLWSAGPSGADFTNTKMNNSIPADVRVLDMTNDEFADRMYVADTGGRTWRLDIHNGNTAGSLVTGGIFASLGVADVASPTTTQKTQDARRFYIAPDASLLRADGRFYLNLAIGSGYRGHPLSTEIHEAFYSLRDPFPFTPMTPANWTAHTVITHSIAGLVDVTTNVKPTIPAGARGWKIELSAPSWEGEKVLSEARTFADAILFPTFKPSGKTSTTTCTAQSGTNALYVVNTKDGSPVMDRDNDATIETSDRVGRLDQGGIAPTPAIFFPQEDDDCTGEECDPPPVCLVGVENCGAFFGNDPVKTFWTHKDTDAQH